MPCRIRRNRYRRPVGGVENRLDKVAAATRTHADGRTRYHGQQKRGQQPKWQLNEQDLKHVTADFEQFRDGIALLASEEARKRHKSDYQREEFAVAHVGKRMTRRTQDILDRLEGQKRVVAAPRPKPQPEPKDDDTTHDYDKPSDAARVAISCSVGEYVYAPPVESTGKVPDIEPLRAALAARGLGLASEGAFYWLVVQGDGHAMKRHGRRDGE